MDILVGHLLGEVMNKDRFVLIETCWDIEHPIADDGKPNTSRTPCVNNPSMLSSTVNGNDDIILTDAKGLRSAVCCRVFGEGGWAE